MNLKFQKASQDIIKRPYLNFQMPGIDLSASIDQQKYSQSLSSQLATMRSQIRMKNAMQCNKQKQYVLSQQSPYSSVDQYDCNQFFDQFENIFFVHQDISKLVKATPSFASIEENNPKFNLFSQAYSNQFKQKIFNKNAKKLSKIKNKSSTILYQKFVDKQNIPPSHQNTRFQQKQKKSHEAQGVIKGKIQKQKFPLEKMWKKQKQNYNESKAVKTQKNKSQIMKTKSSVKSISVNNRNSKKKVSSSRSSLVYIDKLLSNNNSKVHSITNTAKAYDRNYHSFKWVDKCPELYNKPGSIKNVSINLQNPKDYKKRQKKDNKISNKQLPNYYCFNQKALKRSRVQTQRKQGKDLISNKNTERSSNGARSYKDKILSMLS